MYTKLVLTDLIFLSFKIELRLSSWKPKIIGHNCMVLKIFNYVLPSFNYEIENDPTFIRYNNNI